VSNNGRLPLVVEEEDAENDDGNNSLLVLDSSSVHSSSGNNGGKELFLELAYADPKDSKQDIYVEPGWDPNNADEEKNLYKLYVGEDNYYYCRPYRAAYQAVRAGECWPECAISAESCAIFDMHA